MRSYKRERRKRHDWEKKEETKRTITRTEYSYPEHLKKKGKETKK